MAAITLHVNGTERSVDADPTTPLLWILRDNLGLCGTKYSCGRGLCGACTVHVDGAATRSCVTSLAEARAKHITTIEGLAAGGRHPLVRAWIAEQVPQCGYCQSGQIMHAAAFLDRSPHPSEPDIEAAMSEVLCRCGTYRRLRRAIHRVLQEGGAP